MIKKSAIIFLGGLFIFSASCKKQFFTEVNNNPNAPAAVTPATLLSTVEGSLGYVYGGDMSRFASMFMQQTNGVGNQAAAYYQYIFTGQDVDNLWSNLYTSIMLNDVTLMHQSDAKGYKAYSGISRALLAFTLQNTVDFWGSVPYSQAFQGTNNLNPAYDNDATLYAIVQSLCDSAIYFLNDSLPGAVVPGGEDVIYGGSSTEWVKFAHAVKALNYLHQTKTTPALAANAITEIGNSFTSNSDNAVYLFGNASNANGSWYQFNSERSGYISFVTSTLATSLLAKSDPRFTFLFDTSAGALTPGDGLASYYGNDTSVTELITYDELQFMLAEATITKGGSAASAQSAFQNGIASSMAKLGVDSASAATYITANGTLTSANAVAQICNEAWVAMFLNPETWTMWRRTGYPALTPTKAGANIPRRLLYPQSEYSYNTKNTPASSLYTPVIFWDK